MMRVSRQAVIAGLLAGLLAGLILAVLFFVDSGPGSLLHGPASWLALDSKEAGKYAGFILLIVLGGLFGALFGVFQSRGELTLGRALTMGAITGVIFWLLVRLLFGVLINHVGLGFGDFLSSFVPLLVYGVLLGALYFQRVTVGARAS